MDHLNTPANHQLQRNGGRLEWACCGQPDDDEPHCPACVCQECKEPAVELYAGNLCADCTCEHEGHDPVDVHHTSVWCYRCDATWNPFTKTWSNE